MEDSLPEPVSGASDVSVDWPFNAVIKALGTFFIPSPSLTTSRPSDQIETAKVHSNYSIHLVNPLESIAVTLTLHLKSR